MKLKEKLSQQPYELKLSSKNQHRLNCIATEIFQRAFLLGFEKARELAATIHDEDVSECYYLDPTRKWQSFDEALKNLGEEEVDET